LRARGAAPSRPVAVSFRTARRGARHLRQAGRHRFRRALRLGQEPTMRIGVILNPNALGVRRRVGLRARLYALLDGIGELVETPTPADVDAVVRRFLDARVEVIATCGGDGTNLSTLTALVHAAGERLPTFALLRGGTVNTVAENLGVRGEPE